MRVKLINVKKKNRVISYSAGTLNELVSRNLTGFKLFEQGGGRWGIEPTSQTREVFIALSSLIRAGRNEMALTILDNELGGGC